MQQTVGRRNGRRDRVRMIENGRPLDGIRLDRVEGAPKGLLDISSGEARRRDRICTGSACAKENRPTCTEVWHSVVRGLAETVHRQYASV